MLRSLNPLEDPQAMRHAGRELLSLALLDARNHLLARLALDESTPALRLALQAAAYQEHWLACHVQRGRGEGCNPAGIRLAGLAPGITAWLSTAGSTAISAPAPDTVRGYLAQTLDVTLDLLTGTAEDDQALHFFRQSLMLEDRLCEALDVLQRRGAPPARVPREALWLPSQRWQLGSAAQAPTGWVPFNERWAHEVVLPEFEIDAQAVNWAQFVEFAEDGGYDRASCWTDAGWAWAQAVGRRSPAHVEQLRGAVVVQRGPAGPHSLQRAAAGQPAMHVTRHEARAWCQWAGRRLPTEAEWELAACTAVSRGFVWGDVFEWVAGSARCWTDAATAPPGSLDPVPTPGQGVLRGASYATRPRGAHPKARRFADLEHDTMFCGFRSCAL